MEELIQNLKKSFKRLSKSQKQVAKLFFDDPSIIAFSSAVEIGRMVSVSESTVIRLTQTLGYKGYTELQEVIRKSLPQGRVLTQHQEISNIEKDHSLFENLMQGDINNIQNLMDSLVEENLQEATSMIGSAYKIYITGNMSTFGLAHFFTQWLNMLLGNAEILIPGTTQYYSQMSKVDENTLLIPIIFPRYMNSTIKTTELAKKKGSKVLSITDSELSPITAFSDLSIPVAINSKVEVDSYAAVLSLINSLMRYVSIQESERVSENLKVIENEFKEHHVFYNN